MELRADAWYASGGGARACVLGETDGVEEREWDAEYATYTLGNKGNTDYMETICVSKLTLDLFSGGGVHTCSTPVVCRTC